MSLASSSFIYFKFHNPQGSVLIGSLNKMNKIAVTVSPCTCRVEITGQQRTTPRTLPIRQFKISFFSQDTDYLHHKNRNEVAYVFIYLKSPLFWFREQELLLLYGSSKFDNDSLVNFRSSISLKKVLQILTRISWEKKGQNVLSFPLSLQSLNRFWKPDKPAASSSGTNPGGDVGGAHTPPLLCGLLVLK